MDDLPQVTPEQAGGFVAAAAALLASLGGGIRWLAGWRGARAESRAAKLNAWHDELEARETRLDQQRADYQAGIEARLAQLEREYRALSRAFGLVTAALRQRDPKNAALGQAEALIAEALD